MKKSLASFAAAAVLTSGLALAAPAATATVNDGTTASGQASAAAVTKASRKFVRLSFTGEPAYAFPAREKSKVTPEGGGKYVYLQVLRPGTTKWVNLQRQTTTATGVYDFSTFSPKLLRRYKNKFYDIRIGSRYQERVVVWGDAKYKPLKSTTWTVVW